MSTAPPAPSATAFHARTPAFVDLVRLGALALHGAAALTGGAAAGRR